MAGRAIVLGPNHPLTRGQRSNGSVMSNQTRESEEACRLLKRALAIYESDGELESKGALKTASKLAVLLSELDEQAEACELQRSIFTPVVALLPGRPYTLMSLQNLATILSRFGDLGDAKAVATDLLDKKSRDSAETSTATVKAQASF